MPSTSDNTEALANQMPTGGSGEFHAKRETEAPLTTHGVSNFYADRETEQETAL